MIEYSIRNGKFPRAMTEFILTEDNIEATRDLNGKVIINNRVYSYQISYTPLKVSVYGKVPAEVMQVLKMYCTPIPVPPPIGRIKVDPSTSVEVSHHSIPVLLEDETEYLRQALLRGGSEVPRSDRLRHDNIRIKLQEIAEAWEN